MSVLSIVLLGLVLVLALALAAFCAGTETGFSSVNRGRILHMARGGSRAAKIAQKALSNLPKTLTALLVGGFLTARGVRDRRRKANRCRKWRQAS